jgi:Ca-activated chloride channel family protein
MLRMAVAAALLLASILARQPVFKSGTQLVTVPITVTNAARDQLITAGLEAADFRVFEDGVPQAISLVRQQRQPVSLCIVVDGSGSMAAADRLKHGIHALQTTVPGLADEDEVSIVRFSGRARVDVPWTRRLDPSRLWWQVDPDPGTMANSSITDAVKLALEQIDGAANARPVILVISDGFENTSATPLSRFVKTRQQSEVTLYAFGMAGPQERAPSGNRLRNILPDLVGETGGVYWNVSTPTEAEFAAMSLLNELKYQYTLAYAPEKPFDCTYRRIKVETSVKGLAVRHRGGYLALPSQAPGPRPQAP